MKRSFVLWMAAVLCSFAFSAQENGRRAEVLFLGNGQSQDAGRYATWMATKLFKSGVNLTYAEPGKDLDAIMLNKFDAVAVNGAYPALSPASDAALRSFVESGKGLVLVNVTGGKTPAWIPGNAGGRQDIGKGRLFSIAAENNDATWKDRDFLGRLKDGVLWSLGAEVRDNIAALNIPDVDIYHSDTISDYTKRYIVPKMQEALSPEQSCKLTQVPVDFDIQLFAAEPDITKPIAMTWDERGRLWIVESVDYPNAFIESDSAANDRIKICEDTDGDGRADKFTIFADSLNIPTSIVLVNGGAIVSMAPNFIFLKDTDGDDKADVREVIMTGWGKQDTHAGPSNLQYGFDNKIWGVVGYSGFSGKINGKAFRFPMGVYRFKPDVTAFEFLGRSSNNTWGLGFSEDNHVFLSTANNTHSAYYSMPYWHMQRSLPGKDQPTVDAVQKIDGHYDVHAMTPNLRQVDVVGGFTSATGHHLYTARDFPKEYWNRIAFINEPTVRLVHNAIIAPDGAGFREKDGWNLMASSDEWFGPVQAQVGPDGAVWVADWYNFIIQHNVFVEQQAPRETVLPFTEQPQGKGNAFESDLRDDAHGRIYRIVYKKAKPYRPMALSVNDVPGLVAALKNDNMFWRMTAQRLLVESGKQEVIPELYNIIMNPAVDEAGLNSPAVHALWTLHGLGELSTAALAVVSNALKHPAPGVRKAAVEILPKQEKSVGIIAKSGILQDKDLHARVAAIRVLADFPASEQAGALLYRAAAGSPNATDPWLSRALFAAANTHQKGFLAVARAAQPSARGAFRTAIMKGLQQAAYTLDARGGTPFVADAAGREIVIRASVNSRRERMPEGIILVHGDAQNGYGLYMADGKLHMTVNQKGQHYTASSKVALPGELEFTASLLKNGEMILAVNGKETARAKAPGMFAVSPEAPVRWGEDPLEDSRIAEYPEEFRFSGRMQSLALELNLPATTPGTTAKPGASTIPPLVIDMKVVKDIMQYDKKRITVKAGQQVTIRLENPDGMQHNLLIIKPGTLEKVGAAADAMVRDPNASKLQYVPKMPEVLFATRLLNPGEMVSLKFTAPAVPGEYPFVCTFPGHWRGMNGIMTVTK